MHYYAWRASTVECDNCKWVGLGAAMTSGESFGDRVDKHCKICGSRYGFIRYPMSHEMKPLQRELAIGRLGIVVDSHGPAH